MKTQIIRLIIFIIFILTGGIQVTSQTTYSIVPSNSKLTISGTSSLHDWTMEADKFSCNLILNLSNMEVEQITDIRFSLAVKEIRSESNLMDKKAHDALNEDQSPRITFRQTRIESLSSKNGVLSGKISGILSVAGKTKQVIVPFTGEVFENNRISVRGNLSVKMSDFNIKPPTALLGVLKTDDMVKLDYSFEFNPDLISDR